MHTIKCVVDELALLSTTISQEDVNHRILDRLEPRYQFVIDAIQRIPSLLRSCMRNSLIKCSPLGLLMLQSADSFLVPAKLTQTCGSNSYLNRNQNSTQAYRQQFPTTTSNQNPTISFQGALSIV